MHIGVGNWYHAYWCNLCQWFAILFIWILSVLAYGHFKRFVKICKGRIVRTSPFFLFWQLPSLPHFLLSPTISSFSFFFFSSPHFFLIYFLCHPTSPCLFFPLVDSTSIEMILNHIPKHEHCQLAKIIVLTLIICRWSGLGRTFVKLQFLFSRLFGNWGCVNCFKFQVEPSFKQTEVTYPNHLEKLSLFYVIATKGIQKSNHEVWVSIWWQEQFLYQNSIWNLTLHKRFVQILSLTSFSQ